MKTAETDLAIPFSTTTWRWITPMVFGAALGAISLAIPPVRELFQLEVLRWLYIFLFAFLGTGAVTPLMVWIGHRWNLVDIPADRKIHVVPTPRLGGIALYAGLIGSLLLNSIVPDWMVAVLVAGSLLLIIGVLDDIRDLPAWAKLLGQLLAAGIVTASGKVLTLFPPGPLGEMANMLLMILWIVEITNAFNFFDGMDGLATGLAILLAGFMGVIAFETKQPTEERNPRLFFSEMEDRPLSVSRWPVWPSEAIGLIRTPSFRSAIHC